MNYMEKDKLVAIVTRAQAGDGSAFEDLYKAFYKDVFSFARKTVLSTDLACDITQETFLEVIRTIGNLKEPAAFVTWLKTINYHQCTRYFKKKKDLLVTEDEDGGTIFDTLADESEDAIPSEVYEKEEFQAIIRSMIDTLSEEQRAAVQLYYYDRLSIAQIAEILGVSEGTVKSRLNYARKAVRKAVEQYEKEYDTKLHGIVFAPLFGLFFGEETMPAANMLQIQNLVAESAAAGAAAAGGAGAAAAVAAKAGLGAKIAAMPAVTKIIAGVAAVAIAASGAVMALQNAQHEFEDLDGDHYCDDCGQTACSPPTCREENLEGYPHSEAHLDENGDHICDICFCFDHHCQDEDGDCTCDICPAAFHHLDESFCYACDGHGDFTADTVCTQCGAVLG